MDFNFKKELAEATDLLIKKRLEDLPLTKYETGKVTANLGNNKYSVLINGDTFTIPSEGKIYNIGDIVNVVIPNGDRKKKYIRAGYVAPLAGWEKINEILLSANSVKVDFANISGYNYFTIIFVGNGSSSSYTNLYITVNDLVTNYTNYNFTSTSTTNNSTVTTSFAIYNNVPSTLATQSMSEILISNNSQCFFKAQSVGNSNIIQSGGYLNQTISSIDKISLFLSSGSFKLGSKIILLGLK